MTPEAPGAGASSAEPPATTSPAPGSRQVLVLNAGSSSLKAALVVPPDATLWRGEADWGADASREPDRAAALEALLADLERERAGASSSLAAVGHRVVHGGSRFTAPAHIDDDVRAGIRSVAELAPLHNSVALETIEASLTALPDIPHVACFDTAFHATLDDVARTYAIPAAWTSQWGLRRFGFHGLAVGWATHRAAELLGRPVAELQLVVAHLGSGCSVTAVAGGRSVATSMGLTPLEGLMMGTRSGSVDPGLLLHLLSHGLVDVDELADALDHASGLLGVSGRSGDMRVLLGAEADGDAGARLAVAMFVERAASHIAAAATALRGLDAIVFSGGIGEHAPLIRERIVGRLAVLGLPPLPTSAPGGPPEGDARLDAGGPVAVLRIEAREDLVIARQALALLDGDLRRSEPSP